MNNKVSILVPIYGVEKYIERCVRSLFEQTYSNIEYVFVNDCTKDKSIELLINVLEEYPHRKSQVKIIHHGHNRGLSAARNTAVANMTGDYLWHIDSDDYVTIDAVELLVQEIQRTNADVLIFGHKNVYSQKIELCDVNVFEKHKYIKLLLLNSLPASMWNKFYTSSFYKKIGIQSIDGIGQGEDYAVVPRILYYASNIVWFNKPLYFYNLVNQNSYSNNISLSSIKSLKKADDVLYRFFEDKNVYKDVISILYLRSMLFLIKTSNKERYNDILKIYKDKNVYINSNFNKLSLSDKAILCLIRMKCFNIVAFIINIVRKV